jgi:hypothetical protein
MDHFQHISFAAVSSLPDYIDDESLEIYTELIKPVPDLQLFLNTGPRWPGGPSSCQFFFFTMDFIEQLVDHHILEITLYTSGVKCSDTYPGVLPSDGFRKNEALC